MDEERIGGRNGEEREDGEDLGVRARESGEPEGYEALRCHDGAGECADGGGAVAGAEMVYKASYAAPGELPNEGSFKGGSVQRNELVIYARNTEVRRIWSRFLSLGLVLALGAKVNDGANAVSGCQCDLVVGSCSVRLDDDHQFRGLEKSIV